MLSLHSFLLRKIIATSIVLFLSANIVNAKEEGAIIVQNVNVSYVDNSEIYHADFVLKNTTSHIQSNLYVGLEFWNKETKRLVDSHVIDNKTELKQGQAIEEVLDYSLAQYPPGEYDVLVAVGNKTGAAFVWQKLGSFKRKKGAKNIILSDCYLRIISTDGEIHTAHLMDTVQLQKGDSLQLTCTAYSHLNKKVVLTPRIIDRKFTFSNDVLANVVQKNEKIVLDSGESKDFIVTIPVSDSTISHAIQVHFESNEAHVMPVYLRYMSNGEFVIISDVQVDKLNYSAGDVANVKATIWSSQNIFLHDDVAIVIGVKSSNGTDCVENKKVTLPQIENAKNLNIFDFPVQINADCTSPLKISAQMMGVENFRLKNFAGVVGAKDVDKTKKSMPGNVMNDDAHNVSNQRVLLKLILAVVGLALVAVLVVAFKMYKSVRGGMLGIIIFGASISLMGSLSTNIVFAQGGGGGPPGSGHSGTRTNYYGGGPGPTGGPMSGPGGAEYKYVPNNGPQDASGWYTKSPTGKWYPINSGTGTIRVNNNCGDGIKQAWSWAGFNFGEECDDGNNIDGDGCSSTCKIETTSVVCGNNIVEAGEQCDDGNTENGDGCSSTCQTEVAQSICGNGIVETGEECDDGNNDQTDECL